MRNPKVIINIRLMAAIRANPNGHVEMAIDARTITALAHAVRTQGLGAADRAIRRPVPWAQRKRGRPNKASWPLAEVKNPIHHLKAYDVNN